MAALTQEELEACNTPKLGGAIKKLDTEFSDTNNLLNPNPKAIWVKNTGDLKIETIGGSGDKELSPDPSLDNPSDWTFSNCTASNGEFKTTIHGSNLTFFLDDDSFINNGEDYDIQVEVVSRNSVSNIAVYVNGGFETLPSGTGLKNVTVTAGNSGSTGIFAIGGTAVFSLVSIKKSDGSGGEGSIIVLGGVNTDTLINWARIKKIFATGTTASDVYGIY